MSASLKTILDAVLQESGFLTPSSYSGGTNPDDIQMIALCNAAGDALRELDLQTIRRTGTITLTTATNYALPSDFLGYVSDTARVVGRLETVCLPTDPAEWATWKSSGTLPGDTTYCRIIAERLEVLNPIAGKQLRFEYISAFPWTAADGITPKEVATLDTDIWQPDRRLIVLATKWRWKKEKGLPDWQIDAQEFATYVNALRARDNGARALMFDAGDWMPPAPYTNLWVA